MIKPPAANPATKGAIPPGALCKNDPPHGNGDMHHHRLSPMSFSMMTAPAFLLCGDALLCCPKAMPTVAEARAGASLIPSPYKEWGRAQFLPAQWRLLFGTLRCVHIMNPRRSMGRFYFGFAIAGHNHNFEIDASVQDARQTVFHHYAVSHKRNVAAYVPSIQDQTFQTRSCFGKMVIHIRWTAKKIY